ncbi:MAG: AGE family epimerase/isomerase [Oscillospiraceae bacterium]|nr:AGE family epimerase/isomerase [Oscillospiraceae bacterium]
MNYLKYLAEDVLPYWMKITPDYECGGAFCHFENDGTLRNTDKNVWFQGRALWSYSMAYRLCGAKQEYLDICDVIYKFYDKCTLANGRLPHITDREGNAKSIREVYYYSEMFAVMGCAQYYRICKKPEVLKRAEDYFNIVYDLYKKNKYTTQEIGVDFECKTFGLHMAMLATTQFIRNVGLDVEKYNKIIDEVLDEIRNGGFINREEKCINEYVTLQGGTFSGEYGTTCVPGHIYEAAWFVLCEGEVRDDDEIRELGRILVDYSMPDGFEKITQVIPTTYDLSKPLEDALCRSYLTWPQQEAMIAFCLAHNIFGEEKYYELYKMFEKVVFDYYDRFDGSVWLREMYIENGEYANSVGRGCHINGPFHFERVLLAIGSLLETGSIISYMS